MNACLLAALFLPVSASAAVVEAVGAAAPSAAVSASMGAAAGASGLAAIPSVPAAAVLAPSLNAAAVIRAFPGQAVVHLAPAAAFAAPQAAPAPAGAPQPAGPAQAPGQAAAQTPSETIPPGMTATGRAAQGAPSAPKNRAGSVDASVNALADRLDTAGDGAGARESASSDAGRVPAESAAAFGRKIFDRAADRALLSDDAFADHSAAASAASAVPAAGPVSLQASAGRVPAPAADFAAGDEGLRDAVAAPGAAAALPRAALFARPGFAAGTGNGSPAFSSRLPAAARPGVAPSFERLILELGSGLVVKVRSALGLAPAAAAFAPVSPEPASARPASSGAPVTSTEWLERRGLLETLSVSEEAAVQVAAAPRAPVSASSEPNSVPQTSLFASSLLPAPSARAAAPVLPHPAREVPAFALWGLAFLPAGLVLLKELV